MTDFPMPSVFTLDKSRAGKADIVEMYRPVVAGLINCGGAICDSYTAIGTEWLNFMNRRLHTDFSLANSLTKCTTPQQYVEAWTGFFTAAATDYRNQFEKMAEMSSTATEKITSTLQAGGKA